MLALPGAYIEALVEQVSATVSSGCVGDGSCCERDINNYNKVSCSEDGHDVSSSGITLQSMGEMSTPLIILHFV